MDQIPVVSVVFPVFNEAENIRTVYDRVKKILTPLGLSHELVFVDDGSHDTSLEIIRALADRDSTIRFVSLTRNFGHQTAIVAGLSYARGQAVISMDADLQHPPALITEMIRLWQKGYHVVYTTKRSYSTLSFARRNIFRFAYWLLSKLSGLNLSFGQSDFRLLDRRVVNVLVSMPEYRKFLRGLVCWVGFKQIGLEYDVVARYAGQPKYTIGGLFSLLVDGVLAFSITPLRWSLALGLVAGTLSMLYGVWVVLMGILNLLGLEADLPPGWATVVAAVIFLGSIQLIAIGLVSEYVGRVYEQVKGRPTFIVGEHSETSANLHEQTDRSPRQS